MKSNETRRKANFKNSRVFLLPEVSRKKKKEVQVGERKNAQKKRKEYCNLQSSEASLS